ncbi:hypothetical protein Q0M94_24375 (plasmid) [Deinococcus radiomollis]|uniref:hypothetical protein n=1 Tax=Deinococcus radiomollis TaxID=468916 RepID=UPI00389257BD
MLSHDDLLLNLHQIREHGAIHRDAVRAARQHVGVAGLEQTAVLERIIAIGRSQPSISRSLERIAQTLKETQDADNQELLDASQEQLQVVRQFHEVVSEALQTVTSIPMEEISVQTLTEIDASVKEQLITLEGLVHDVQAQSTAQGQTHPLTQVSEDVQEVLEAIEMEEASGQVESLSLTSQEAVVQIAALVHAPTEQQIAALDDLADAARAQADLLRNQDPDGPDIA